MKVNFTNLKVKDLEGNENIVDISKDLAKILYASAIKIDALQDAKELFDTGEIELNKDSVEQIKSIIANNFFATVQVAANELLGNVTKEVEDEVAQVDD